jgi:hypothetical protein
MAKNLSWGRKLHGSVLAIFRGGPVFFRRLSGAHLTLRVLDCTAISSNYFKKICFNSSCALGCGNK